jgi:GntR family transcriptional repressor for pyruvate dehydrogenase complex
VTFDSVAPRRTKVSDQVIEDLQAAIISGKLAIGSKLPSERELAGELGVSQPTVREAVRALTTLGLIEVRHGSGAYVSSDPGASISNMLSLLVQLEHVRIIDVLEIRQALGVYSVRRAVEHATDEEIAKLRQLAAKINEEDTALGLAEAILEFQVAASAAAHHPLLFAIECFIFELLMKFQYDVYQHESADFWRKRAVMMAPDRGRLLDALEERDADKAGEMTGVYLEQLAKRWEKEPDLMNIELSGPDAMRTLSQTGIRVPRAYGIQP